MKKLIYFVLLSLFIVDFANADNILIQGQVTNNQNYVGIANHTIYVTDSNTYFDTITTGINGYYSKQITGITPNSNLSYYVTTKDCNNAVHYGIAYSVDSLTIINFSICDTTPVNCHNSFTYTKQNLLFNFSASNLISFPTIYNWIFSDGYTASGQNISHSFQQPASGQVVYTVTLNTVTLLPNLDTCQSQSIQYIHIFANIPRICGFITKANAVQSEGYVLLYGINNPLGTCNLIDSVTMDTNGFYYFINIATNFTAYLVKAMLPANSTLNNKYISTYYNSQYSWVYSIPLLPDTTDILYNIDFIPYYLISAGIGSISGNVSQFSTTLSTIPVSGIEVLLLNQNNKPIKLTNTDPQGNYIFLNLPYDNYKLYVEKIGKISELASVNLNNLNTNINNINFFIKGNDIALSAEEVNSVFYTMSEIYPNPSNADVYLDVILNKTTKMEISIFNQLGQLVYSKADTYSAGQEKITLNTRNLIKGIYSVRISTNHTSCFIKKLVLVK
ncbi:MAG: T9SS type A sorting domain-containing protein [Bacteroidetes bacterium]|nr:T9SS type A sorting domain-containing protein [Bacteroidota bacterium]